MQAKVIDYISTRLFWIVALIVSLESATQAVQGVLDGRLDHAVLWISSAGLLFGAGFLAEKVKMHGGG